VKLTTAAALSLMKSLALFALVLLRAAPAGALVAPSAAAPARSLALRASPLPPPPSPSDDDEAVAAATTGSRGRRAALRRFGGAAGGAAASLAIGGGGGAVTPLLGGFGGVGALLRPPAAAAAAGVGEEGFTVPLAALLAPLADAPVRDVVLTGANSGVGLAAAKILVAAGL